MPVDMRAKPYYLDDEAVQWVEMCIRDRQGEVFGFLGPNGAGKTTTIRQLMGFLAPDSGTCTINGLDCRTQTAAIQKNMGYIPGEPALPDEDVYKRQRCFWACIPLYGVSRSPLSLLWR